MPLPIYHPYKKFPPVYDSEIGLWTPAEIFTALWLDAADSDTIVLNGATVSQWSDKSGNAKHATQANSAYQPISDDDGWDGYLRALIFDGTNDVLTTAYTLSVQHSVFFVAERGEQTVDTSSILRPVVEAAAVSTGSTGLCSYGTQRGTLENIEHAMESTRVATVTGNWVKTEKIISGTTYNGSTLTGYKNASAYGSVSVSSTSRYVTYIGGSPNTNFPVRRFAGKIAEIIICPYAVTSNVRLRIEGYLAHKWGLALSLPSTHPYRNFTPILESSRMLNYFTAMNLEGR